MRSSIGSSTTASPSASTDPRCGCPTTIRIPPHRDAVASAQPSTKTTDRLRPHDRHRQTGPGGITAPGLAHNELPRYFEHRLRLAATELSLFTPLATEALFQATHGMPRKVNRIAHYAAAARERAQQVTDQRLHAALEELRP